MFRSALTCLVLAFMLTNLSIADGKTKWEPLFDGKTLDGWVVKCLPKDKDKRDYWKVVDQCFMCDLCYQTKCPYVPPHEWNLDFPHVMLRAKAVQFKKGERRISHKLLSNTKVQGAVATLPVISNVTGGFYPSGDGVGDQVIDLLGRQIDQDRGMVIEGELDGRPLAPAGVEVDMKDRRLSGEDRRGTVTAELQAAQVPPGQVDGVAAEACEQEGQQVRIQRGE